MNSAYQILGVAPDADNKTIQAAFRKLALKTHPDVCKDRNAKEKFLRIKDAYDLLIDPTSRRIYDTLDALSAFGNTFANIGGDSIFFRPD